MIPNWVRRSRIGPGSNPRWACDPQAHVLSPAIIKIARLLAASPRNAADPPLPASLAGQTPGVRSRAEDLGQALRRGRRPCKPRQHVVDLLRRMVGQLRKDPGEPSSRIDVVVSRGLDQGVDGRGSWPPASDPQKVQFRLPRAIPLNAACKRLLPQRRVELQAEGARPHCSKGRSGRRQKASEDRTVVQAVIDGLGSFASGRKDRPQPNQRGRRARLFEERAFAILVPGSGASAPARCDREATMTGLAVFGRLSRVRDRPKVPRFTTRNRVAQEAGPRPRIARSTWAVRGPANRYERPSRPGAWRSGSRMPIGPVLPEWSISCRVAGSWRPSSCAASPVVLSLSASTRQLGKLQMTQKTSLSFALQQGSSRRGRIVRHRLNGEQLQREKYKMSALTLDTRRAKDFNLM